MQLRRFSEWIRGATGKSCSLRTLRRLLRSSGLAWKRLRNSLAGQRDEVMFELFKEELEILGQMADNKEIDLVYFDETGICLNPNVPYGWQPVGYTATLPAIRKGSATVLGILDVCNQKFQGAIFDGASNAACVERVLDDFSLRLTRKTVMVLDNASIHTANAIKERQAEWKKRGLFLQFIPAYCPELNLIEILWKQLKHFWLEPKDYQNISTLKKAVTDILAEYGGKYLISFG